MTHAESLILTAAPSDCLGQLVYHRFTSASDEPIYSIYLCTVCGGLVSTRMGQPHADNHAVAFPVPA